LLQIVSAGGGEMLVLDCFSASGLNLGFSTLEKKKNIELIGCSIKVFAQAVIAFLKNHALIPFSGS